MAKRIKRTRSTKALSLDAMLGEAEVQEGFFNLPTGTYEGRIRADSGKLELKAGTKDEYFAVFFIKVTEGEFEGKEQRAKFDLSSQVGVNIFITQLSNMEINVPPTKRDMADALEETDNLLVSFWVGEREDEYPPKVRINELLEDGNGGSAGEPSGSSPSDGLDAGYVKDLGKEADDESDPNNQESIGELEKLAVEDGFNPDNYVTWAELAKAIVKYRELK